MDIKRILRSYDFESTHAEYFAALEHLENLWKTLKSCRVEAKLATIHNKVDHTTSSTSDDNRKTVISSILERFPSLLEENSKIITIIIIIIIIIILITKIIILITLVMI